MQLNDLQFQENFVKVKEYCINLKNVSSFKVETDKLIFNMSYTTKTKSGFESDFIFIDGYCNADVSVILENPYFKENFIKIFNTCYSRRFC